jgi:aminoglycoside 3-N-acetyltransferase
MFSQLPRNAKLALKGWFKRGHHAYLRRWHAFDAPELLALLRRLGVSPGDVVIVHSSFDEFQGFTGTAMDAIRVLQEAVGQNGTLLMPTLPFTGTAVDYALQAPVFDVMRTPSRMGLLTELFRRSPGVVRSVHPTHPVAAWGAKAEELITGHHLSQTPCGAGSPFARLLVHDGRILLLGTGIGSMTFFHTVEEILESELPFTPFTKETFILQSRDRAGATVTSKMRLFDPECSRRRNLDKLVPALKEQGVWKQGRVGKLDVILLDAKAVLEVCRSLAKNGIYCYDP